MKKTIGMMAALMLMAGSAMACAQQPEKKDAPETTEASAPAAATDGQQTPAGDEAAKADSTAADTTGEQSKTASESTGEGSSSAASENSASSAE